MFQSDKVSDTNMTSLAIQHYQPQKPNSLLLWKQGKQSNGPRTYYRSLVTLLVNCPPSWSTANQHSPCPKPRTSQTNGTPQPQILLAMWPSWNWNHCTHLHTNLWPTCQYLHKGTAAANCWETPHTIRIEKLISAIITELLHQGGVLKGWFINTIPIPLPHQPMFAPVYSSVRRLLS